MRRTGCQAAASVRGILIDDLGKFPFFNFFKALSLSVERLECFDDGFCHSAVSFFGATDNGESFRLGNALVPVRVIEADPQ